MIDLDASKWQDLVTSRGAKYHYYHSLAHPSKPTILLVHGFPSLGRDWRDLAFPLQASGYGIVVPDMFGYGGSDKPADPAQYRVKLLCQDLIDILDVVGLEQVVAVGHDWGSAVVSRMASYFPERFLAFAYLAIPYIIPDPDLDFEKLVAMMTSILGYNPYGYWEFFNEDNAADVFAKHLETYIAITYTKDQGQVFRRHVCPPGALKQALLDNFVPPAGIAPYMSAEDINIITDTFRRDTLAGPLCYYKYEMRGMNRSDIATIPPDRLLPPVTTPLFFAAGQGDVICPPKLGRLIFGSEPFKYHNVTIKEFNGDHWFNIENAEEVARELVAWVARVVGSARGEGM
ncbi:epoxide hydrolase [Cristinia sonorae]|uniref:Epoxide hydrolase n=1 Tax=Cristinia sonorae TaxID=1940300 RepID=A0A8K0UXM1_9AGAR|nr:epoxide hydrolase [Cristinia sonorae]